MNKKDLVVQIAEKTGLTQRDVSSVLDSCFERIGAALEAGESVRLLGFGTFETKSRAARSGKNPRTGETVEIPATTLPVFKAGKNLKDIVSKG